MKEVILKKILLKKPAEVKVRKRISYKVPYDNDLNPAQYEAVMHNNGAALVIAGAGTGKTRTLIYRVSRMVEDGVPPESILLLTFTRKASAEMLRRAAGMLDGRCEKVSGGTFHSFALQILRRYAKLIGYDPSFNVLDQGDSGDVISLLRSQLKLDRSKRRFPRKESLSKMFNLSINRCESIENTVINEFPQFVDDLDQIEILFNQYTDYKKKYSLMDYDDMLLNLLELIKNHPKVKNEVNKKYKYVMVDEYQDTNKLQHQLVLQLAGENENIMAVGDDAQSIYSFRGANFKNIMNFPKDFKECKVYTIEENYRSTQPILDMTNFMIGSAAFRYEKDLYTSRLGGEIPKIISAESERQQSEFIVQQVLELREEGLELDDIAILARSGFLTFDLEIELNRANIPYHKFGGLKFAETAHIKDIMAYLKIIHNNNDAISWHRSLLLLEGVGPRTATKIIDTITTKKLTLKKKADISTEVKSKENVNKLFTVLSELSRGRSAVSEKVNRLATYYKPLMKSKYDDWKKRWKDIEMFITISERYRSLNEFLNDMAIEPPLDSVNDLLPESKEDEFITLSTIHSAKGLEWKAVFIIWALDGRLPSTKSAENIDTMEEERRLFYVASTRARDNLYITYPTNIFDRESGLILSKPSRFLDGISEEIAEKYVLQSWDPEMN